MIGETYISDGIEYEVVKADRSKVVFKNIKSGDHYKVSMYMFNKSGLVKKRR